MGALDQAYFVAGLPSRNCFELAARGLIVMRRGPTRTQNKVVWNVTKSPQSASVRYG
jgi:hypothetical protein